MRRKHNKKGLSPKMIGQNGHFEYSPMGRNMKSLQKSNENLFQSLKNPMIEGSPSFSFNMKSFSQKKSKSERIIVTSQEEHELLTYLKHSPKLPPISLGLKQSGSKLDDILKKKRKYKKSYFAQVYGYHKHGDKKYINYQFEELHIGNWKIVGYIMDDFIILKAKNSRGKQHYGKFSYEEEYHEIRRNYPEWVQNTFSHALS